jgi:hypothetical protein
MPSWSLSSLAPGKNLKGRVLAIVLGTIGKHALGERVREHRQGHRIPERLGGHGGPQLTPL